MANWNEDVSYDNLAHHGYGERDELRRAQNEDEAWMERDLPHPDEERENDVHE